MLHHSQKNVRRQREKLVQNEKMFQFVWSATESYHWTLNALARLETLFPKAEILDLEAVPAIGLHWRNKRMPNHYVLQIVKNTDNAEAMRFEFCTNFSTESVGAITKI